MSLASLKNTYDARFKLLHCWGRGDIAMYVMNRNALDKAEDIRRGLHVAMTALITNNDYAQAEHVLKQMDDNLGELIAQTQVVAPRS